MAYVTICDICKKKIKRLPHYNSVSVSNYQAKHPSQEYCFKCWTNPKNFSKIHEIKKEKN
jgi:hypothetical protein